jgi:quinol monooxygenase YgiN
MAEHVRMREPGYRSFEVSQAVGSPDDWVLYEVYENQAALEAHRASEHFKVIILGKVVPLLEHRVPRVYELVVPSESNEQ